MLGQAPSPKQVQLPLDLRHSEIQQLKNGENLAKYLGYSWTFLRYNLYRRSNESKYRQFTVRKRSGGERVILAPCDEIKAIQHAILIRVLYVIARPKDTAHGFCPGRSILTGASEHVRSRFVLNTDLENFFPTINFGRVFGMLKAKPYSLSPKIAAILAHACCYAGQLPQGAPTSPMIANMVCGKLDGDLARLAQRNGMIYTRYADDITFSTRRRQFPDNIGTLDPSSPSNITLVGSHLEKIIQSNGFSINHAKTRLKDKTQRMEVTGLVVNKKISIKRTYVRTLRAAIHALEVYGEDAERLFKERYNRTDSGSLKATIAGRLEFLKQVRGPLDSLYLHLAKQAHQIDDQFFIAPDRADLGLYIRDRNWVIESNGKEGQNQGSGFLLRGFGLITCAHVIGSEIVAYRPHKPNEKLGCNVRVIDNERDLAILDVVGDFPDFEPALSEEPRLHQPIFVCGFPNYSGGTTNCSPGYITSFRKMFSTDRFIASQPIIKGNSGGPVLNSRWKVIGIAATGGESLAHPGNDIDSTCIKVQELLRLQIPTA